MTRKKSLLSAFALLILNSNLFATEPANQWIENYITNTPDFPKESIQFKSYPNLLKNPEAFRRVIQTFAARYCDLNLDAIVGLDSRGFIFGAALAYEMKIPFMMIRKAGNCLEKLKRSITH